MNTITLTIAATPDNLRRLAAAFGDVIDETIPADAIPAKRYAADAPGEPDGRSAQIRVPEKKPAAPKDPTVPEIAESVAKTAKSVAKPAENVAKRTLSELRAKAAALVKDGHRDEIKALLTEFGAPKVPDLPEDTWNAFYARLEGIA